MRKNRFKTEREDPTLSLAAMEFSSLSLGIELARIRLSPEGVSSVTFP